MGGRIVAFNVKGAPVPQGSVVAHAARRKDGSHYATIHYEVGTKLHAWRRAIGVAAREVWGDELTFGPVALTISFQIARPLSHYRGLEKLIRESHIGDVPDGRPDLDKLIRAVLDSLTDIVYADDAQVTYVVASKVYAAEGGVEIIVDALP